MSAVPAAAQGLFMKEISPFLSVQAVAALSIPAPERKEIAIELEPSLTQFLSNPRFS